jgi:type II secretory pathway component PulJ
MPIPLRHSPCVGSQFAGSGRFKLVELLVAIAIGGLGLNGAVVILVSHMRASGRLAALRYLQDHCSWVQVLINREIEQAERTNPAADNGQLPLQIPGNDDRITTVHDTASRLL